MKSKKKISKEEFFPKFNNPHYRKETWWDHTKSVMGGIIILSIVALSMYSCVSCSEEENRRVQQLYKNTPFHKGDMVKAKVSGQTGQVLSVECYKQCWYNVRFNAVNTRTNTHLIAHDGFMENYPIIVVRDMQVFELEKIK